MTQTKRDECECCRYETGMSDMTPNQVERVVRITLEISKAHWLKHGTPISPEDAALVMLDVLGKLGHPDREGAAE